MSAPRVVALGGGHGLARTLRAVRRYAGDVTAIVSVADDGGSSGRLREALGIPAPGDLRKCLVALGDPESVMARMFEHRFEAGELRGHAVGNLVIAALVATTGDLVPALDEAARVLGVEKAGRVLPATREPVVLKADTREGPVEGQVAVAEASDIRRVSVVPADAHPPREALDAIAAADQIVLGPGSLYTSVLAAVAAPALRAAVAARAERVVYVCNLRPGADETVGFDVAAHVRAVVDHGIVPAVVVCDCRGIELGEMPSGVRAVDAPVAGDDGGAHDPARLAAALADLVG